MIWLSRPETFNDVFELQPHFETFEHLQYPVPLGATAAQVAKIARLQKHLNDRVLRPKIKEATIASHTKTIVVLSLTQARDSLLIWAHYGDAHKGVALGFDSRTGILENYSQHRDKLQKVKYSRFRPSRETWERVTNSDLWLVKSKEWAYEREWRIVDSAFSSDALPEPVEKGKDPVHYPFKFKAKALVQVIIGCRAAEDVLPAVEATAEKYPNLKIWKARKHPKRFKIERAYTWERE